MRKGLSTEKLKQLYRHLARRYDFQHGLITAKTDQKGRRLVVEKSVYEGAHVLDCGSGTGSTALLAVQRAGPNGSVTLFDLSDAMLDVAQQKLQQAGLQDRVTYEVGDMVKLPFTDNSFDVVLSTYSLCPIYDPANAALELYRVTKPGGRIGVAHSTEPRNHLVKWLADRVENIAWHFPWLSMGCRTVDVMPALEKAGAKIVYQKYIGVPLWPFFVFVAEKPMEE